jgi:hypothetical protein
VLVDRRLHAGASVICREGSSTQQSAEAVTSSTLMLISSTSLPPQMPPTLLDAHSDSASEHSLVFQQAEASAYPAVFRGLNKSWPALQRWAGLEGLKHLQEAAGDATVQVTAGSQSFCSLSSLHRYSSARCCCCAAHVSRCTCCAAGHVCSQQRVLW